MCVCVCTKSEGRTQGQLELLLPLVLLMNVCTATMDVAVDGLAVDVLEVPPIQLAPPATHTHTHYPTTALLLTPNLSSNSPSHCCIAGARGLV